MQTIVSGKLVGYDRQGEGKTILLLHGWGANRQTMRAIYAVLLDNYDVINVDVPGFGESEKPDEPWGLADFVTWLQAFAKKIGAGKIYAIIGHSNGGAIAIKYAASGLDVSKLILIGASGIRNRDRGAKLFYKAISKTGKAATSFLPKPVKAKLKKRWYKTIGSEYLDNPGLEATFKKVTKEDLLVDAAMINAKTLLLYGSNDNATPPSYGQSYSEVIHGSKFSQVEGAGHYAHLDAPEVVLPAIKDFLK